jgi:hypothetical protein
VVGIEMAAVLERKKRMKVIRERIKGNMKYLNRYNLILTENWETKKPADEAGFRLVNKID